MERKNFILISCLIFLLTVACSNEKDKNSWAMLPFTKIDSVNPILSPGAGEFLCPVLKTKVKWEEKDVF